MTPDEALSILFRCYDPGYHPEIVQEAHETLRKGLGDLRSEVASWKDAWFTQRDRTGRYGAQLRRARNPCI